MGKAFEIGERAFQFAAQTVRLCRELERQDDVSRTLARQLLRSATSIGANIEEAKAGQSRADFISKYAIALKEARETAYWLRLLATTSRSRADAYPVLQREAQELAKSVAAIVVKAKTNDRKPQKEQRNSRESQP